MLQGIEKQNHVDGIQLNIFDLDYRTVPGIEMNKLDANTHLRWSGILVFLLPSLQRLS